MSHADKPSHAVKMLMSIQVRITSGLSNWVLVQT